MAYEHILTEVKDSILTVTLNRPDKLNAYTGTMQREMVDALEKANTDDSVRAIVVTGAGRAFCAGADISEGAAGFDFSGEGASPAGADGTVDWSDERIRDSGGRLTLALFNCLKPVIAAVNGAAVGVGATMQLAMDIRIASETARFGFVFARRGIVPEACSSWFLPKIVGIAQALEWCYSGRVFDAQEALRGGLVREIVRPEELLPRAYAIAAEIRDNTSPVSIALIRQMLWKLSALDHPMDAHRIDSRGIYARSASADAKEGVESFLEKRPAKFPQTVSGDMPAYFPWWQEPRYS
jgi:enoyl-CoA hydratase/carnithine racemase